MKDNTLSKIGALTALAIATTGVVVLGKKIFSKKEDIKSAEPQMEKIFLKEDNLKSFKREIKVKRKKVLKQKNTDDLLVMLKRAKETIIISEDRIQVAKAQLDFDLINEILEERISS